VYTVKDPDKDYLSAYKDLKKKKKRKKRQRDDKTSISGNS
jgi:hypothetical protein